MFLTTTFDLESIKILALCELDKVDLIPKVQVHNLRSSNIEINLIRGLFKLHR
jgi:hypothetical protein